MRPDRYDLALSVKSARQLRKCIGETRIKFASTLFQKHLEAQEKGWDKYK